MPVKPRSCHCSKGDVMAGYVHLMGANRMACTCSTDPFRTRIHAFYICDPVIAAKTHCLLQAGICQGKERGQGKGGVGVRTISSRGLQSLVATSSRSGWDLIGWGDSSTGASRCRRLHERVHSCSFWWPCRCGGRAGRAGHLIHRTPQCLQHQQQQ